MKTSRIQAPLGVNFDRVGRIDRLKMKLHYTVNGRSYFNIPMDLCRDLKLHNGSQLYIVIYCPVGPYIVPKKASGYGNGLRIMVSLFDKLMGELTDGSFYTVLFVPWLEDVS